MGNHGLIFKDKYMDTIVDFYISEGHEETEIIGQNNVEEIDAKKALAFLKLKKCSRKVKEA